MFKIIKKYSCVLFGTFMFLFLFCINPIDCHADTVTYHTETQSDGSDKITTKYENNSIKFTIQTIENSDYNEDSTPFHYVMSYNAGCTATMKIYDKKDGTCLMSKVGNFSKYVAGSDPVNTTQIFGYYNFTVEVPDTSESDLTDMGLTKKKLNNNSYYCEVKLSYPSSSVVDCTMSSWTENYSEADRCSSTPVYQTRECSVCGGVQFVQKNKPHTLTNDSDFEVVNTRIRNCTESGCEATFVFYCDVCHEEIEIEYSGGNIEVSGSSWQKQDDVFYEYLRIDNSDVVITPTIKVTQAATCTTPEYISVKYKVQIKRPQNRDKYATKSSVGSTENECYIHEPLGHNYETVTSPNKYIRTAQTCNHAATYYQPCTRCGNIDEDRYNSVGSKKGHNWVWYVDSDLTCTTNYTGHQYCTNTCHDTNKKSETYDGSRTQNTGTVLYTAPGHHYEQLVIDVPPTCTTAGKAHYRCTNYLNGKQCTACGDTFTIPATGHYITSDTVTTTPSVYENGVRKYKCEWCGEYVTESEIPNREFNIYIGDNRVTEIRLGDELVWNGSVGDSESDGGHTTCDDIFTIVENDWYYKNSLYHNN